MSTYADREALPYPPFQVSADDLEPNQPWWLVFDQSEGFQPMTIAVQAEYAEDAEDIYMGMTKGEANDESIVIMPIVPSLPHVDDQSVTWFYDGRRLGAFNRSPGGR